MTGARQQPPELHYFNQAAQHLHLWWAAVDLQLERLHQREGFSEDELLSGVWSDTYFLLVALIRLRRASTFIAEKIVNIQPTLNEHVQEATRSFDAAVPTSWS